MAALAAVLKLLPAPGTKLQARDRTQLVVIAYETGLVTPSGS